MNRGTADAAPADLAAHAAAILAEPSRVEPYLELARRLRAIDQTGLAMEVLDACALQHGRDCARRLAHDLGGPPCERLGRAFAAAAPAMRRPRPSPERSRYLLPGETHWFVVQPESAVLLPLEYSDSTGPADWLDGERVCFAKQTGLFVETLGSDERAVPRQLWTAPGPIVGMLVVEKRVLLAVDTPLSASLDLFVVELGASAVMVRRLGNLSLRLESDAIAWTSGMVCFGAGIQAAELRLVQAADGSWRTSTVHAARVCLLAPGHAGRGGFVSLDEAGQLLFWGAQRFSPMAKLRFDGPGDWMTAAELQGIYDVPGHQLLLCRREHPPMIFEVGKASSVLLSEPLSSPPLGFCDAATAIPLLASDGWLWIRHRERAMPAAWRLSPALATVDEIQAAPLSRTTKQLLAQAASMVSAAGPADDAATALLLAELQRACAAELHRLRWPRPVLTMLARADLL